MYLPSQSLTTGLQTLQTLILSYHPVIVIETVEEERVQNLLQAVTQEMGLTLMEWSATQGLTRSYSQAPNGGQSENRWHNEYAPPSTQKPAAHEGTTEPDKLLEHLQAMTTKAVFMLKDFSQHLDNPTIQRQFREVVQLFSRSRSVIILTGDNIEIPSEISLESVYYDLGLPGQDELHQVMLDTVRTLRIKNRVQVEVQDRDMPSLVHALSGMTLNQARQVVAYAALDDGKLTLDDVDRILDRKAQIIRKDGVLEFFPVDDQPIDLGGFNGLKQWLGEAQVGFTPQARALNLPSPKGILIVGIQGCGKSLAAKAIARAWKMPLLKLDAGRLYDKYVGESEKNFRKVIKLAESMAPAVLWIDEIEKSLGNSGGDSDGGLSRRLFGSFLTWMQEKSEAVFVIATANDISQIPPELLRKGRFDEIFFVDLPDAQERATILQIHLCRRQQQPSQFNFGELVAATDGFSGAEIEQAVIAAMYRSLYLNQPLSTALLVSSIKATVPLSVARREDVQRLRAIAQERFVNVR
jgi:ATPase family associated with various cellular activities (AAA)